MCVDRYTPPVGERRQAADMVEVPMRQDDLRRRPPECPLSRTPDRAAVAGKTCIDERPRAATLLAFGDEVHIHHQRA